MTDAEHTMHRPPLSRLLVILFVLACVPIAAWWLQRVADLPAGQFFEGPTTSEIGNDYRIFATAGHVVASGDAQDLYNFEFFVSELRDHTGLNASQNAVFVNAPAFAVVMVPLSVLPWQTGWIVWTVLGIGALVLSLWAFGIAAPWRVAALVLLTFPAYMAITTGQSTLFWLLVVAGTFVAITQDRLRLSGAVAGLLILKPPMLIGFALWWAIDRRYWKALTALGGSVFAVIALSWPVARGAWLRYPKALIGFSDLPSSGGESRQFSPWGFTELLVPGASGIGTLVGLAASLAGLVVFVRWLRRCSDDVPLAFVGSLLVMLWVSPHVLVHDWLLLVPVFALLWVNRPEHRARWMLAGAALLFVSTWGSIFTNVTRSAFGWGLQLAVPAIALFAWLIITTTDSHHVDSPEVASLK